MTTTRAVRWAPPPYPDNPRDLHPDCTLAREYAAMLAEQRDRHLPEPAYLVRLRADVDHWHAVLADPDATSLAYTEAQRKLARHEPELERLEQAHADVERARAQDRLRVSLRWQQRWDAYLELRRNLLAAAASAHAEEQLSRYDRRGRHHHTELVRQVELMVGPASLYLPVEETASALP